MLSKAGFWLAMMLEATTSAGAVLTFHRQLLKLTLKPAAACFAVTTSLSAVLLSAQIMQLVNTADRLSVIILLPYCT